MKSQKMLPVKLVLLFFLCLSWVGCDLIKNINTLVGNVNAFAKKMSSTITQAKGSALTATATSPAAIANIPALPASATGGEDLSAQSDGDLGTFTVDMYDDGGSITLQVYVDAADTVFLAWEGSAITEDEGVCYLAWEKTDGSTWITFTDCGSSEGAYVCSIQGDDENITVDCNACNVDGNCNTCNMAAEDFECTWPAK